MKIVDLDDKYAQIEVDEKSITKVFVGQKAFIYPSSDTSLKLETTVREIDKTSLVVKGIDLELADEIYDLKSRIAQGESDIDSNRVLIGTSPLQMSSI